MRLRFSPSKYPGYGSCRLWSRNRASTLFASAYSSRATTRHAMRMNKVSPAPMRHLTTEARCGR